MSKEFDAHRAAIELAKSHIPEIQAACDTLTNDLQTRLDSLRKLYPDPKYQDVYNEIQIMINQYKDMISEGIKGDNIEYVEKSWCGGNKSFYVGIKNTIDELQTKIEKAGKVQYRKTIALNALVIGVIVLFIILLIGYFIWKWISEHAYFVRLNIPERNGWIRYETR